MSEEEKKTEAFSDQESAGEIVSAAAVVAPAVTSPVVEEAPLTEETIRHPDPDMKWYIVHAQSGFEAKAKVSLEENIRRNHKESEFGRILIPVESVVELVKGQKKSTERKFFPGYLLVQMKLNEYTWHLVKQTPRITGFVGNARTPPALPEEEVLRITSQMRDGLNKARPKYTFKEGDNIRVIDGPFSNFNGTVEEVKPEKSKLRVLVSIFGRATPVELDFIQVEKT